MKATWIVITLVIAALITFLAFKSRTPLVERAGKEEVTSEEQAYSVVEEEMEEALANMTMEDIESALIGG